MKTIFFIGSATNFDPQMDAWYRFGAAIIGPRKSDFQ